jgi:hypothetical protein
LNLKNSIHRLIPAFWLCISLQTVFAADGPSGKLEYFEQHVRPLLANRCYNCHSADNKAAGGLRLDDGNGLLSGGGRGPAVIPGDMAGSLLIRAVEHTDPQLKMPPENRISNSELEVLKRWIADGAVWPQAQRPEDLDLMDAEYATVVSHSDGTLSSAALARFTFSMMSAASLVHTKVFGLALCSTI